MTNPVMLQKLVHDYTMHAAAHRYLFGFVLKHVVYVAEADESILPYIAVLDKASSKNGGGLTLKFHPTTAQKMLLMANARPLCSEEFFMAQVRNSKYNKGDIFEKMLTEKAGQTWTKDHVRFDKDGDLTVDGIAYQIKFDKATFASEALLASLH